MDRSESMLLCALSQERSHVSNIKTGPKITFTGDGCKSIASLFRVYSVIVAEGGCESRQRADDRMMRATVATVMRVVVTQGCPGFAHRKSNLPPECARKLWLQEHPVFFICWERRSHTS